VSPTNPTITNGTSQQFTATGTYSDGNTRNVTSQTTWTSSSSAVAVVNAGGLATGVSAGTTTIYATLAGQSGSSTLTVQVAPLVITTSFLPNGMTSVAYTATLAASGGTTPYLWSLASGSLPTGLKLNSNSGTITGTPTAAGTNSFTVQVSDAGNPIKTATQALSIIISINPVVGNGTIGNTNEGTSTDYIWSNGAWINACRYQAASNMMVSTMRAKVAAITGKYKCAIYTDNNGQPSRLLRSTVEMSNPGSGWQIFPLTSSVLLTNGQNYWLAIWSDDASASIYYFGNNGTLRWGRYNYGTWPDPIGTTGGGSFNYCIYATGTRATLTNIAVTPANPTILAGGAQPFTATGTYSDGSTQNITRQATWNSSSPAVATINTSGLATAAAAGSTTISATLAGKSGSSVLTVQTPVVITTSSLANGTVNVAYTATLVATGGTTPYTWSLVSGSLPAGLTLDSTNGAITGTPTSAGTAHLTVRVSDTGNPVQTVTKSLSIAVVTTLTTATIWPVTAVPKLVDSGVASSVELGVKFRSDVAGTITGIRFYKAGANTGTHVGNLWTINGTRLATATFTGETASGWQQMSFAAPVAISANTVYVASYHANNGHYSTDVNYFSTGGVDNPPLHALRSGVSGGNGVYSYGTGSMFPNQTWNTANYWVDVVFKPATP
jgi:hypothetical protein